MFIRLAERRVGSSSQWGDTGQRGGAALVPITSLISSRPCLLDT